MIRLLSTTAAAVFLALPALACEGFGVHEPYARSSTPTATSGAAFMVLHNHGTGDCRVVGARTPMAQRAELHTHTADANGVMRMREVEGGFFMAPDSEVILERGGFHVMLMGLTGPMIQDETFPLVLIFEDGAEFELTVPVDNARMPGQGAAAPMQGSGHSHNH